MSHWKQRCEHGFLGSHNTGSGSGAEIGWCDGPNPNESLQAQLSAALEDKRKAEADLKAYMEDSAVSCAFCEARHERPCTFEDLKAHIFVCPKHPLAEVRSERDALAEDKRKLEAQIQENGWRDQLERTEVRLTQAVELLGRLYRSSCGTPTHWAASNDTGAFLAEVKP